MSESIIVEGIEFEEGIDGYRLKLNLENGKTEEVYDTHLISEILSILELEIGTKENVHGKIVSTLLNWYRVKEL